MVRVLAIPGASAGCGNLRRRAEKSRSYRPVGAVVPPPARRMGRGVNVSREEGLAC